MICRLLTYLTNCLFGKPVTVAVKKEVKMKEDVMTEAHRLANFEDLGTIHWNVPEIRRRINELSQEIRALKKEMRTPHHQVTWNEQCELGALKHRVTVLVVLQAFRRGKNHFVNRKFESGQSYSLADQESWLESHLDLHDRRELAIVETPTS